VISRKLPHQIMIWFLHTSRSVHTKHVYNVRACSFYYIKWRHRVNLLQLDNALLQLQDIVQHRRVLHQMICIRWTNAVWGALQEMVYHCRSFKSSQELKSAIVTARQQQSQAFLDRRTYWSVNLLKRTRPALTAPNHFCIRLCYCSRISYE